MVFCNLSDLTSWFQCASNVGFGEITSIVVFVVFFVLMKNYPARDSWLAASVVALFYSGALLGAGLISQLMVLTWLILMLSGLVFLSNQTTN